MERWKIKYYARENESSPVYEFIEELPERVQSKLINTFNLLQDYGIRIREPHAKKVIGTPLWELRILGHNNIRIFYIAVVELTFLMLHGFKKKTQKTPKKEIQLALNRLEEYTTRMAKR